MAPDAGEQEGLSKGRRRPASDARRSRMRSRVIGPAEDRHTSPCWRQGRPDAAHQRRWSASAPHPDESTRHGDTGARGSAVQGVVNLQRHPAHWAASTLAAGGSESGSTSPPSPECWESCARDWASLEGAAPRKDRQLTVMQMMAVHTMPERPVHRARTLRDVTLIPGR